MHPEPAQLRALLDEAEEIIVRLRRVGPEVLRRSRAGGSGAAVGGGGDGYPTSSGPAAGGGGGDATSVPERTALLRWSDDRIAGGGQAAADELVDPIGRPGGADPVRRAANGMLAALQVAVAKLRCADGDADAVVGRSRETADAIGTKATDVGSCWCCGLPASPIVAGMCRPCVLAWDVEGRPDRAGFRLRRRQALAAGRLVAKVMGRVIPDKALRLPELPAMAACALCGHDPACGRAVGWLDDRQVLLCESVTHSCYGRWIAGERPG